MTTAAPFHPTATALGIIRLEVLGEDIDALDLCWIHHRDRQALGTALVDVLSMACRRLVDAAAEDIRGTGWRQGNLEGIARIVANVLEDMATLAAPIDPDRQEADLSAFVTAMLDQQIAHQLVDHPDD